MLSFTAFYIVPPYNGAGDGAQWHPFLIPQNGVSITVTPSITHTWFPGSQYGAATAYFGVTDMTQSLGGSFGTIYSPLNFFVYTMAWADSGGGSNVPSSVEWSQSPAGSTFQAQFVPKTSTSPNTWDFSDPANDPAQLGALIVPAGGAWNVARFDITVSNPLRFTSPPPPQHFREEDKEKFEKDSQSLDTISHGLDIATSKSQQDLILQDAKWRASALTDSLAPQVGRANAVSQAILTITETVNSVKDAHPVGLVLNASSAFASLGSIVLGWLHDDPPGGNFTQVYAPQSMTFNIAGASTADNALLTDMYKLVQDSLVMLTSAERYEGAELAGDANSRSLQDAAFNAGQSNNTTDTQEVSTDLTAVLNELVAQGVPDATLDGSDLAARQVYLQSAGLSDPFLSQLSSDLSNLIGSSIAQADVQTLLASIEAEQAPPTGGSLYVSLSAAASELANNSSSTPKIADFTGSGTSDVLLQNGGTVVDWLMQNGQYSSGNALTSGATGWTVVGTGNFTGTGTGDVLLQNGGTVVDWIMQNGQYQSGNVLTTAAAGWNVVGTGDYNDDGTSDVLLQNGGTVVDWIVKNGAYQSANVITNSAAGFQVAKT